MDTEIIVEAYIKKSANIFKNSIELLSQTTPIKKCDISNRSVKQIFLKISASSICINTNTNNDVQVYINLEADKFCCYKYNYKYPDLNIGINANILKTFLKYAKKSEGVVLRIRKSKDQIFPSDVEINIYSDDNQFRGTSIKLNIIQNTVINTLETTQELVTITSNKFLSVCKEMGSKKIAKITSKNKTVVFSNNEADVATKWIPFPAHFNIEFSNYIKAEYIKNIAKLASFNDTLKMYKHNDYIIFKSPISKCITKLKAASDFIGTIVVNIRLEPENDLSEDEDILYKKFT